MIRHNRVQGFTLIELLITIAIMGIIAAMAAPSMQSQIATMRTREAFNLIESTLREARSDAMTYRKDITVTIDNTNKTITSTSVTKDAKGENQADNVRKFNKNVDISGESLSVTFRPTKTTSSDSVLDWGFCYSSYGKSPNQAILSIKPDSNVVATSKSGGCS